jgi:hypothetical protein
MKYLNSQEKLPDQGKMPHVLTMFDRDDYFTKGRPMFPLVYGHFSYFTCFGLMFWFFGLLGMFFAVASFFVTKPETPDDSEVHTVL